MKSVKADGIQWVAEPTGAFANAQNGTTQTVSLPCGFYYVTSFGGVKLISEVESQTIDSLDNAQAGSGSYSGFLVGSWAPLFIHVNQPGGITVYVKELQFSPAVSPTPIMFQRVRWLGLEGDA